MSQVAILEKNLKINDLQHSFMRELIQQFRWQDSEENYSHFSDEQLLESWLKKSDRVSEKLVDSLVKLQISAFYHAVAAQVEKATGKFAQTILNLNQSGLSSVLISCGNLLVFVDVFQPIYHFNFNSLEGLIETAERLIYQAIYRIRQFF